MGFLTRFFVTSPPPPPFVGEIGAASLLASLPSTLWVKTSHASEQAHFLHKVETAIGDKTSLSEIEAMEAIAEGVANVLISRTQVEHENRTMDEHHNHSNALQANADDYRKTAQLILNEALLKSEPSRAATPSLGSITYA